jgi:hypothetical protein
VLRGHPRCFFGGRGGRGCRVGVGLFGVGALPLLEGARQGGELLRERFARVELFAQLCGRQVCTHLSRLSFFFF